MVGSWLESSRSISSRGGLFGRRKKSSAAATCALPPPPSSSRPDAVVAEQLHQLDLRLKQLEEIQIVRQPRRPLPPPASSPPPPPPVPPPPAAVAPGAPPKAQVLKMRPSCCFSAELRRAAEAAAAKFAHRQQQRQPDLVHVRPLLERQVPPRVQIGNNNDVQLQQQQHKSSSSSSSSCSMTSIARLRDANLRSSLMERLRLLEDRIFQLSFELDHERNSGSSRGSPSTTTTATTRTRQTAWSSSDKEWPPQSTMASSSSTGGGVDRAAAEMAIVLSVSSSSSSSSSSQNRFTLGERFQAHILSKMKKPAKDSKLQVVTQLDEAGKAYHCKKEKKRMERTRIYKRWFPLIGC